MFPTKSAGTCYNCCSRPITQYSYNSRPTQLTSEHWSTHRYDEKDLRCLHCLCNRYSFKLTCVYRSSIDNDRNTACHIYNNNTCQKIPKRDWKLQQIEEHLKQNSSISTGPRLVSSRCLE